MSNELIIVKQLPIIEEHLRALASEIDKRVTDATPIPVLRPSIKRASPTNSRTLTPT